MTDLQETTQILQLEACLHKPVQCLSAGQKRRAALARLLLFKRCVWILDEPLTALDIQTQEMIHEKIAAHLTEGGICVLTSHQPLSQTLQSMQQVELLSC